MLVQNKVLSSSISDFFFFIFIDKLCRNTQWVLKPWSHPWPCSFKGRKCLTNTVAQGKYFFFLVQFIVYFLFFMWESSHVNYKYTSNDNMLLRIHGINFFVKPPSQGNIYLCILVYHLMEIYSNICLNKVETNVIFMWFLIALLFTSSRLSCLKFTVLSNMLILSSLPENCSYADASGAGNDVYEYVSLSDSWAFWLYAFTNVSHFLRCLSPPPFLVARL